MSEKIGRSIEEGQEPPKEREQDVVPVERQPELPPQDAPDQDTADKE